MSFEDWCAALNEAAVDRGYEYSMVSGDRYTDDTGEDCWRPYFDDDFTPLDALIEDEQNA